VDLNGPCWILMDLGGSWVELGWILGGSLWIIVDPGGSSWILVDVGGPWVDLGWILKDFGESWVDLSGSWVNLVWILADLGWILRGSWWILLDLRSQWILGGP
jgi:hypothetical protein